MTEHEVLNLQAENGETVFYLMQRGSFFHAYGNGAFALARVTGYKVLRKQRKAGDIFTAGFQVASLQKVLGLLQDAGASVEEQSSMLILFSGIDGTPDETLVFQARTQPRSVSADGSHDDYQWLADEIQNFNLSLSSPMEAMNFLSRLQGIILQKGKPGFHIDGENKNCIAPSGRLEERKRFGSNCAPKPGGRGVCPPLRHE